jgi:hypothetical protein
MSCSLSLLLSLIVRIAHATLAGIVRCCFAGERSDRAARSADPGRGTVLEARTEGLRRLYGESPVQADPVSLVSQS